MNPNIAFLLNQTPDQSGRFVLEYRTWSESKWEECHDHMQWAFPTRTKSAYNPDAATIPAEFNVNLMMTGGDLQRCRATISLLLHSYLKSLGVEFLINHDRVTMTTVRQYPDWAASCDHNTLRMTRVLECLGIFEMYNIQTALHDFLVYTIAPKNSDRISTKTVAFWVAAKENKLHLLR